MKIVLIVDDIDFDESTANPLNRQVDRIHRYYVEEMTQGIRDAGYDVQLYTSPAELIANVHKHSADLVFPYWQGIHSKNRHALKTNNTKSNNITNTPTYITPKQ